jgi:cell wall-associated NlpC family hydrolase
VLTATAAAAVAAVLLPAAPPATPAPAAAVTAAPVTTAPAVVAAPVDLAAASAPLVPAAPAGPSPAATAALTNAMSKIGSPYRYGAAGPNAFDCSGLVNWSFKQAGVSLPRTSRALAGVGTPVARGDLQPGDLVFFYRPISHVAIYIGDGKVVHASTRKSPVKVSNLNDLTYNTARRL